MRRGLLIQMSSKMAAIDRTRACKSVCPHFLHGGCAAAGNHLLTTYLFDQVFGRHVQTLEQANSLQDFTLSHSVTSRLLVPFSNAKHAGLQHGLPDDAECNPTFDASPCV